MHYYFHNSISTFHVVHVLSNDSNLIDNHLLHLGQYIPTDHWPFKSIKVLWDGYGYWIMIYIALDFLMCIPLFIFLTIPNERQNIVLGQYSR